jgi:hypothetical protein
MAMCGLATAAIAGCGGSGRGGMISGQGGTASTPLTLGQVESNLQQAGYKITMYSPNEGALYIDSSHKGDAGFSIDYSPNGQQLYAAVYETRDPSVRAAVISHNSDETPPIVRGTLIFTISGTAPELQTIVKDAKDAGPNSGTGSGSPSAASSAKAAVRKFISIYATGDEKSVCASLTRQARETSQALCNPHSVLYKRKPDPRVRAYAIVGVTTSGAAATATVSFEGVTEQLALRQVGDRWKIDTKLGAGRLF